ncbi:exodeoxyribonuclease VII large subunit [Patescibacteria group bacterium]|nr:exodeoxyribonuclease VII large subunit [Patescibacteria group bacterium]
MKDEEKIFKVSEFNEFISTYLGQVGEIVVEGEISEIRASMDKWLFATIKDKEASVAVFGLVFKLPGYDLLEPGMLVHVYGTPRLYKKTGQFSVFASRIVPAGEGALALAFEKLKSKLDKEGLFDIDRKRVPPVFPEKIGLITAKNSRAYSDFIKVLKNRMGGLKIYFYPVSVQGRESVPTIINAIERLNKSKKDLDLIVLTRGGGSLEDLQSFNDELVARAIFSSKIPVVSAVGHEEDVSIADLVADTMASTASNAAELIVRDRKEVIKEINFFIKNIEKSLTALVNERNYTILRQVNVLKTAVDREVSALYRIVAKFGTKFAIFSKEVGSLHQETMNAKRNLIKTVDFWIAKQKNSIESLTRLFKSLDFRRVLKRGYSITVDKKGLIIKSVSKVKKGQKITTTVYDGKIGSKVLGVNKK